MKIHTRIILSYLCLISIGFYCLLVWVIDDIKPRMMESVEESMVDSAYILSSVISDQLTSNMNSLNLLKETFKGIYKETFEANVFEITKRSVDMQVLIMDQKGIVVFDSNEGKSEQKDFSRWNDVHRTLKGQYGARSSLIDPNDSDSRALFVAAPIKNNNQIIGVLTLIKPKKNIYRFFKMAKKKIILAGCIAFFFVIIFGILISHWITRPIFKLIGYTSAIQKNENVSLPPLGNSEMSILGVSLEKMRQKLEGKEYIEKYVTTLTHELKSPLSAIRGSAELLNEEMPKEKRRQFLENILREVQRVRQIIDQLLDLSLIEKKNSLTEVTQINLLETLQEIEQSFISLLKEKKLSIHIFGDLEISVHGDLFLIRQSLSNLIQNAIDFSFVESDIKVDVKRQSEYAEIEITNKGTCIPDYAMGKIFDRFYSIPRPHSGIKSTGLGLCFVKQVATLHQGYIHIENISDRGVKAIFRLKS